MNKMKSKTYKALEKYEDPTKHKLSRL